MDISKGKTVRDLNKYMQSSQQDPIKSVDISQGKNIRLTPEYQKSLLGLQNPSVAVGNTGIGKSQFDKNIPLGDIDDLQVIRATRQPWTHQFGNAVARGLSSGVMTAIEDAGYILDFDNNIKRLADIENVESNWLSDWAKNNKEALREALPIYRKRPDQTFDWSDSGFYYDMFANVLDTAVGFGAVGMGAGLAVKGAGALFKGLAGAGNLAKAERMRGWAQNIGQSLQQGNLGNLGAAYITNFGEGKMMALELYENSYNSNLESFIEDYKIKNNGVDPDENTIKDFQLKSSDIAGKKADNFMMLNKLMVASEAFQLAGLFKATGLTRNMLDKPGFLSVAKQQIKQAPIEAGEEVFQNVMSMEQQFQGEQDLRALGVNVKNPISTNMDMVSRLTDFATSDQALLEGMMGLFSGPIQYTATALPFQNFKEQQKRYDDQQVQLEANKEFFENKLLVTANKLKAKQEAQETDNPLYAEFIQNNEFDQLAVENFARGTTQNLYDTLNEELASDKYTEEEKTTIKDKIKRLESLEQTYTQFSKYAAAPLIMQNRLDRDSKLDLISKINQQNGTYNAEVEKIFTPILERYNKNSSPEKQITISDVMKAFDSIDYEAFGTAYRKFQEENKTPDGKLVVPTIEQTKQILEETNPNAFEILNRRPATKDLLLNNEVVQNIIGNKTAASNLESQIENLLKTENSLKSPIYNIGFDQMQSIIYNNKDTDTKIDQLNKLETKVKSNPEITRLVQTTRAGLEARLQESKENNNVLPDPEGQANKAAVENVKTKATRTPGKPKGKVPGVPAENADDVDLNDAEAEELNNLFAEEEGKEDTSLIKMSVQDQEGLEDVRNILWSEAMQGEGEYTTQQVANLSNEELSAIRAQMDEERTQQGRDNLKELKKTIKDNPESFQEEMPVLPNTLSAPTIEAPVSDIETKKADIAKRREESSNSIKEKYDKGIDATVYSATVTDANGNKKTISEAFLGGREKLEERIKQFYDLEEGNLGQEKAKPLNEQNLTVKRSTFEGEYSTLESVSIINEKGETIASASRKFGKGLTEAIEAELKKLGINKSLREIENPTVTTTTTPPKKQPNKKVEVAEKEISLGQTKLPEGAEPEVRSYNSSSADSNKTLVQSEGKKEVLNSQNDVKVNMSDATAEFLQWATNGKDKANTPVTYTIDYRSNFPSGVKALGIYDRLLASKQNTANPRPSNEELTFMINNLPVIMSIDGVPNASTFLYTVREKGSGIAASLERQLRTQIINNSLQGAETKGIVTGNYGGDLAILDDSEDDRNILDIPDLANTASKDVPILYVDPEGGLRNGAVPNQEFGSLDLTFTETKVNLKSTGKPMVGALFIPVMKANGRPFPLKVNVRPFSDSEVQFVTTILRDLLIRPETDASGIKLNKLSQKVPQVLLDLLNPNDRKFLGSPTYSEALSFMVYEGEGSKTNPVTQLYISKGKLYFGGEVMQLNDFLTPKLNTLQDFIRTYKTRNVNLRRLSTDPTYKEHILSSGVITTNANTDANPNTLFESLNLKENYKDVADRELNRFREASVYVKPVLNNAAPETSTTETKTLEVKSKESNLPIVNTTATTKKQTEQMQSDIDKVNAKVGAAGTNVDLGALNSAIQANQDKFNVDLDKKKAFLNKKKKKDC
jgi:hypothetical protein